MQSPVLDDSPRRNYIRRKRCLNESIDIIEKTLQIIYQFRKENVDKNEISKRARAHANEVEAACWAPRMKMSDDDYQSLMETKTKELCLVLVKKLIPTVDKSIPASPGAINQKRLQKPIIQNPKTNTSHPNMKQAKIVGLPPESIAKVTQQKQAISKQNPSVKVQTQKLDITPFDPWADFSIPLHDPSENSVNFLPSFIEPVDTLDELSMIVDNPTNFTNSHLFQGGSFDMMI